MRNMTITREKETFWNNVSTGETRAGGGTGVSNALELAGRGAQVGPFSLTLGAELVCT